MNLFRILFRHRRVLMTVALTGVLFSCRGSDDNQGLINEDVLDFVATPDPDRFNLYLNTDLGTQQLNTPGEGPGAAYNRTVDPNSTRDTFEKWRAANGFTGEANDATFASCELDDKCCVINKDKTTAGSACTTVMTRAAFRDTRDLGYGRDLYMKHDRVNGDVAIYVRNFKMDEAQGLPAGLPYGPLNLEALIQNHHASQFGISAIEFSGFPMNERKFAKFFTFNGDVVDDQKSRLDKIDLATRGQEVHMPNACSTCHGGRGRTSMDSVGNKLLPTLKDGVAGDVHGHLQMIDLESVQFASASGYTRADQEAALRAVNNAVLHSYEVYKDNTPEVSDNAYWDPTAAISMLKGRYPAAADGQTNCDINNGQPFDCLRGQYNGSHIPDSWATVNPAAFRNLIAPNCLSCHLLKGTVANPSVSFHNSESFYDYADRTDELVFAKGLMPSGIWNYREFWDYKDPLPMAEMLGLNRIENGQVVLPGRPVASISAPPVVARGAEVELVATGSMFVEQYEWDIPSASAQIIAYESEDRSRVRIKVLETASTDTPFNVTLRVGTNCDNHDCTDTVAIEAAVPSADLHGISADSRVVLGVLQEANCLLCHTASNSQGLPAFEFDSQDNLCKRINVNDPKESLLLRKGLNGASRFGDDPIRNYHTGSTGENGVLLSKDSVAAIVNWIHLEGNKRLAGQGTQECGN